MTTIYYEAPFSDDVRRQQLFDGQLFVYAPRPSTIAFCDFARTLIQEAFGTLYPPTAQHHLPVEQYAAILGKLKPGFIHHPESKEHIRKIFAEMGCDLTKSYFDVPKMRSSTSDNYLTTGIAYAWHPHRDTWYSAPDCQINWWIPIYDIESDNAMAFHPRYWNRPVRNTSSVDDAAPASGTAGVGEAISACRRASRSSSGSAPQSSRPSSDASAASCAAESWRRSRLAR